MEFGKKKLDSFPLCGRLEKRGKLMKKYNYIACDLSKIKKQYSPKWLATPSAILKSLYLDPNKKYGQFQLPFYAMNGSNEAMYCEALISLHYQIGADATYRIYNLEFEIQCDTHKTPTYKKGGREMMMSTKMINSMVYSCYWKALRDLKNVVEMVNEKYRTVAA